MARKKLKGKTALIAEIVAEVIGVFVAAVLGLVYFGKHFETAEDFWRDVITGSIATVVSLLVAVRVMRWQAARKAEKAEAATDEAASTAETDPQSSVEG